MSGLHHVGVRPRSLRYYTTERHSVIDSALHPIADMCGALANVRFGPIADIGDITTLRGVRRLRAAKSPLFR